MLFLLASLPALAQSASQVWVGSWASSQMIADGNNALPAEEMKDATLRQIVHLSLGGAAIRLHLSNAFGKQPLHLTAVHVALPKVNTSSAIDPATDKAITFNGQTDVVIAAGAESVSDPLPFAVTPLSDLTVSIHYEQAPAVQTGHPGSRATSFLAPQLPADAPRLPNARRVAHWYQLSAVDVLAPAGASAVVFLGDSITDGFGTTTDNNERWTDVLAARLQADAAHRQIGVLNQGIGGNCLLRSCLGPAALARFDRDVLAQTGVKTLVLLEGVNDLGGFTMKSDPPAGEHAAFVKQLLDGYQQILDRAHAKGLRVVGATIMPYTDSGYYHPPASNEADRQTINQWIRAAGHFDAVLDFDQLMRDPARPDHLLPACDSGDHLHPSVAGYKVMGEAVSLAVVAP